MAPLNPFSSFIVLDTQKIHEAVLFKTIYSGNEKSLEWGNLMNFNKNFKMEVKIRVSSKLITSLTTVNIYLVQKNNQERKKSTKNRREHEQNMRQPLIKPWLFVTYNIV